MRLHRVRIIAMLSTLIIALGALVGTSTQPAQAADASKWDPGYIIADSIFYNGNAMNTIDVQNFLNSHISGSCRSGYVCLKDYTQAISGAAANAMCSVVPGGTFNAAQMIAMVGSACGINQAVLLTLLEKEQSLVSDNWPYGTQYTSATGYGCPDTSVCDPSNAGFFNQVYGAAWQFRAYLANPSGWNYHAYTTNQIYYSPDHSCGTKSVYIANEATRALYIYTPYTPDDAAMANLYGTGDSCSAYGNRNFWRIFSDWFGNPQTYDVNPGLASAWQAAGGASGYMGAPISYAIYVSQNGQGWFQTFAGGTLYGSYYGGTMFVANNVFASTYIAYYGPYGPMGFPSGPQVCTTGVRCSQAFVNAIVNYTPSWGAHLLWGGFVTAWNASGGIAGSLGPALNDNRNTVNASGTGWVQHFQNAVVVIDSAGTITLPYGPIVDAWYQSGAENGWMGWPTAGSQCNSDGCATTFQSVDFTSSQNWGLRQLFGGFKAFWESKGGINGLGPALTDIRYAATSGGGWAQHFAQGVVTQTTGAAPIFTPYGPILNTWYAYGAEATWLGWPTAAQTCTNGSCTQQFQHGVARSVGTAVSFTTQ